jgi:Mycoplasma protein of unknown function, DUF285
MKNMFGSASSFTGSNGDLSNWETWNVKDLSSMFYMSAYRGSLSNWNTTQVTDMSYMFYQSDFDGVIAGWTTSRVQDFSYMCKWTEVRSAVSQEIPLTRSRYCNFLNTKSTTRLYSVAICPSGTRQPQRQCMQW